MNTCIDKEMEHGRNSNRNRKLEISTAPAKGKSREPAYLQAFIQNKIHRQRVRCRESGWQTVRRLWWIVFGVETGREGERRGSMMVEKHLSIPALASCLPAHFV